MKAHEQLRRDDASMSLVTACQQVRLAIEKVARSQAWEIEGATPFPSDILPMLHEASKLLNRAHDRAREHAKQHVWPARQRLVAQQRLEVAFQADAR